MANPRNLWVRDALYHDGDFGSPQSFRADLLWKARTGTNIQGSNSPALHLVQPQERASDVPGQRAFFDRPLAPQDISGALVKRVFIKCQVVYAPILNVLADGVAGIDEWNQAGIYTGLMVENSVDNGYRISPSQAAGDVAASVTLDWLHNERHYLFQPGADKSRAVLLSGGTASSTYLQSLSIDVKSQRRLKEWDDSLTFMVEPSLNRTINSIVLAWSVLLNTPG